MPTSCTRPPPSPALVNCDDLPLSVIVVIFCVKDDERGLAFSLQELALDQEFDKFVLLVVSNCLKLAFKVFYYFAKYNLGRSIYEASFPPPSL